MLAKARCLAFCGLEVIEVTVEVSVSRGMPAFEIVGLPNKAIEESKHRIKSAFINSGLKFPDNKITVNLAPADLHKVGSAYDLAIAACIYSAQNGLELNSKYYYYGELSLSGIVHAARGAYLALDYVNNIHGTILISPELHPIFYDFTFARILSVYNLQQVTNHIAGKIDIQEFEPSGKPDSDTYQKFSSEILISDIVGQESAKRAIEICSAGGHNLMLVGSPGTGKSMLAKSIISIVPPLNSSELIAVRKINSYVGKELLDPYVRPFRSPHHTISYAGMLGGGVEPLLGEVSLAHKGVLFMDEYCEFSRNVLEALRQPLQDKTISFSRRNTVYKFPCDFSLVAASNPCPCGYLGHLTKSCICSEQKISLYKKKLSGPLADRIDLTVQVFPEADFTNNVESQRNSNQLLSIKNRILLARNLQQQRLKKYEINTNSLMTNNILLRECKLNGECKKLIDAAYVTFNFSPRAYFNIIKVARTIADLENCLDITPNHLAEAIRYRQK